MEVIVPVVVSDLVCRLVSKLVHTYQERENVGQTLRRLPLKLISIRASIEEAEQRFITNQLILLQLKTFTEVLAQGYYLLDSFESKGSNDEEDSGQHEVRPVYSFSSFNPYNECAECLTM